MNKLQQLIMIGLTSSLLFACGGGGGSNETNNKTPSVNQTPSANAGQNQTIDAGSTVTFTGSGTDSDGTIVSYQWTQTSGIEVTLLDAQSASTSFIAPRVDDKETLTFELMVTDNDNATGKNSITITVNNVINNGGTIATPATINLNTRNAISSDSANNFFSYDLKDNDTLYIQVHLDNGFDLEAPYRRCTAQPGEYIGIQILDEQNNIIAKTCSPNLGYKISTSGIYKIRLGFPYNDTGYFEADIVNGESVLSSKATGNGGKPSNPGLISLTENNAISSDNIFNYYAIEGLAGESIAIYTYLNSNVLDLDKNRCSAVSGGAWAFGISKNKGKYNCAEETTYTFANDGVLYLHLRYLRQIDGYFTAVKY